MVNIFNDLTIPKQFFNLSLNITHDLYYYLFDNLQKENYKTLSWDLKTALIINANGEYI
jgi:hypothetical protein